MIRYALLPAVLALCACTVGPDHEPPIQPLAAAFAEGDAQPVGDAALQSWWRSYDDALLSELVQAGLRQNLDIRTALSRVAEAQAATKCW